MPGSDTTPEQDYLAEEADTSTEAGASGDNPVTKVSLGGFTCKAEENEAGRSAVAG